jgi:hypothetical protein
MSWLRTVGTKWAGRLPPIFLSAALIGCAINGRLTARQAGEPYNIARALHRGEGFANPFGDRVRPKTAAAVSISRSSYLAGAAAAAELGR